MVPMRSLLEDFSVYQVLLCRLEYEDDARFGVDVEPDSDIEDQESDSQLSQWLSELENYAKVHTLILMVKGLSS